MISHHKIGHWCEKLALLALMLKGYLPVDTNVVTGRGTGAGEIDLIVRKGKTLIFVEVKKRTTYAKGVDAITIENQMRIVRASAAYLKRHPIYQKWRIRYDAVICLPWRWPKHIKDAWRIM
ncbi:MAG: YraN family protein [Alphaproteobacteria bacterium]|nr:YraN family protein [Alphaproteobacteria bacterium]